MAPKNVDGITFDKWGNPIGKTHNQSMKEIVIGILGLFMVGVSLIVLIKVWTDTPPPLPVVAYQASPPSYPPEVIQAAVALSTAFAPTPSPTPRPTEVPVAKASPTPICYNLPQDEVGVICDWGEEPDPPATPLPICDTPVPFQLCVKEGPLDPWVWTPEVSDATPQSDG